MMYLNKSFSVPAAPPNQDAGEWDAIFGTEAQRKKKMAAACAKTKERKRRGETDFVQLVGDATDGFTSQNNEILTQMCEEHNIPPAMVRDKTREAFEKNAGILKRGGDILKDDK